MSQPKKPRQRERLPTHVGPFGAHLLGEELRPLAEFVRIAQCRAQNFPDNKDWK
jgi:hypothetical protein